MHPQCYGECDASAPGAPASRKQLLDALLYATRAPSGDEYGKRMRAASDLSAGWNKRTWEIGEAIKSCDWATARAFVLKLRLPAGSGRELLTFPPDSSAPDIHFAVLFRNPAQRVVSGMRMAAGAGQFATSKEAAAAPIEVQFERLRREMQFYLSTLQATHGVLYRLGAMFLTVGYDDILHRPRQVLSATLGFMGLPRSEQLSTASSFKQSAPPALRAKVRNMDAVCAAAREDAHLYVWLKDECEAA